MKRKFRSWFLVLSSWFLVLGAAVAAHAGAEPGFFHELRTKNQEHFAIRYNSRTGVFAVAPAAPVGPSDINQVFTHVFDATNNALRVNASLTPGGQHTPNDANQVSISVFDSTNNALRVNCIIGCGGGS